MNRRNFLRKFGIGAGVAIAAPLVARALVVEGPEEYNDFEAIRGIIKPKPRRFHGAQYPMTYDEAYGPGKWRSIYDIEIKPEVMENLFKRYGEGFCVRDFLQFP